MTGVDPIQVGPVVLNPSSSDMPRCDLEQLTFSQRIYCLPKPVCLWYFQAQVKPSLLEKVFALPICLHGCENWLLTDQLLRLPG